MPIGMNATVDRILGNRTVKLPDAFAQPLAEFEAEVNARASAAIEAANRLRLQAEQRADKEREAREAVDEKLKTETALRLKFEAEAIREKAARQASDGKVREAESRAAQVRGLYDAERQKHELTQAEKNRLRGQLMTAQAEAKAARDEVARLKREKPPVVKPLTYDVKWTDREGRERIMTVTPRS